MDKQEAIAYIHQRLDQNATCEEIVRVLVEQLHAPEAMVAKFVANTEAEYRKNKPQTLPTPATPQPVTLPPWLEELSIGAQPTQANNQPVEPQPDWMQRLAQGPTVSGAAEVASTPEPLPEWAQPSSQSESPAQTPPSPTTPSWEKEAIEFVTTQLKYGRLHSDIAEELADRVGIPLDQAQRVVTGIAVQVESPAPQKITNTREAAEFVNSKYAEGISKLEIAAELATRTGEPQDLTEKFVTLTIAKLDKAKAQKPPTPSSEKSSTQLDNPALEKFVISELSKNRKRSDIVMAICERTGVHWSEAQRFVGQVYAEQNSTINARKNRMIIPMCIGAIILGFAFTITTIVPVLYLVSGRKDEFYARVSSMGSISDYVQYAWVIFGMGIAMIAGGIIGLITAMQSQME
jgi:hypothetical protein